jgi:NAD(P)-dependent dehydrogenase (short-subunit alcohol dehydrogenase family)
MRDKRVVLVTGASSGIGAAVASRLVKDGHVVFGTGRSASGTTADGAVLLPLDVCSSLSVRSCVEEVVRRAGRIDTVVNNAGYLLAGAIEEVSLEQAQAQFETNFFGVVRMVQAVLPIMRKQGSGQILNVSSLAGLVPMPFWGFYNASKAAVESFSESLRIELKPLGIRVAVVEPGTIKTPFYAQPVTAAGRDYEPWRGRAFKAMKAFEAQAPGPEAVARSISRIVASDLRRLRNPVTLQATLLTALRRIVPDAIFEPVMRFAFKLDHD